MNVQGFGCNSQVESVKFKALASNNSENITPIHNWL
jgi:hypothetical protein